MVVLTKIKGTRWYIWSLEHGMWWRPNWQGYTPDKASAGVYSFEVAQGIVKNANEHLGEDAPPNEAMILDNRG